MVQRARISAQLVYEDWFSNSSPTKIHRRNLRFGQSLDVAGLSDLDVAVTQNRLDLFVRNSERVKIRYQSAAEGVPPSPHGDVEHLLDVGVRLNYCYRVGAMKRDSELGPSSANREGGRLSVSRSLRSFCTTRFSPF